MQSFPRFLVVAIVGVSLVLSGCAGLLAGGAATTGVVVAQERSAGDALDDVTIRTEISHYYLQRDVNNLFAKVGIEVNEGRVLLTGTVPNEEIMLEAVRLAWQANGVKEVINELQITNKGGFVDYAKDVWITAQVKGKLLVDKRVKSVNYTVETVNGTVYLFGIAQDRTELDVVTQIAATTRYVKKVVSHVRLKDDPLRK